MDDAEDKPTRLPTPGQIRRAIDIYLRRAYQDPPPESIQPFLPAEGNFVPADWLMSEAFERDPPDAPLDEIRSASLRLGNQYYPHMKLRLSRTPREGLMLFSIDSHDAILRAEPGSADCAMLEELKARNAKLCEAILAEWDRADLPTERNYLRHKIEQARLEKRSRNAADSEPPKGD